MTSTAETLLEAQIDQAKLPVPFREYRFDMDRRWRFDFAFILVGRKVAVEVDGGSWIAGRHTRGEGFEKDLEKLNEAALAGWVVLRVTPRMVDNGTALELLRRALG